MNKDQLEMFEVIVNDFCEVLKENYNNGESPVVLERDFYDFTTGLQTMYVVMSGVLGLEQVTVIATKIWNKVKEELIDEA